MRSPFMSIVVMLVTIITSDLVSHATIVYHSAGITVEGGEYLLDLNGDGVPDFVLSVDRQSQFPPCNHSVEIKETSVASNLALPGPLSKGVPIGPGEGFTGGTQ